MVAVERARRANDTVNDLAMFPKYDPIWRTYENATEIRLIYLAKFEYEARNTK